MTCFFWPLISTHSLPGLMKSSSVGVQVQRVAHLVEVGHLQVRALAHLAGGQGHIGLQLAQNQLEQRAFAGAVGPQQADLVAAQQGRAETVDDDFGGPRVAKTFRHIRQFGHDLAALVAARDVQVDAAHRIAPRRAVVAQGFEPADARHTAGAARFHALADPDLFLRQQLVGLGVDDGFLRHLLFLLHQVLVVAAGEAEQPAPVEFADARGELVEEGPVVGDEQHGALPGADAVLEPLDRDDVQVVGGLVEEQEVGLADQRLREADAPAPAAGQLADRLVGGQHHLGHHQLDALVDAPAVQLVDAVLQVVEALQAGLVELLVRELLVLVHQGADVRESVGDDFPHGGIQRLRQFLLEGAHHEPVAVLDEAAVRLHDPGDQAEEGGLAGAVAADQANALVRFQRKICVVQQCDVPKSELSVKKCN